MTPRLAAEYSLSHLGLAEPLRGNIRQQRFAAGHMMYIDARERAALATALRQFIGEAP